jgi:tetratricopeptide (TPR) repeat protein
MDTLYDLLGALPHDNAESLRAAFRRSVKGAHPDLKPGDPDAGLKFRQIVRANGILGDPEQRAVYDHLLMLAHHEKDPASAHPIAARIHRLASGVMVIAIASIVTLGGYFLFMHMSMALVAPVANADATTRQPAKVEAASPAVSSGAPEETVSIANPDLFSEAIIPRTVPVIQVESIAPIDIIPPASLSIGAPATPPANEAGFFRSRGISAYRNGDLDGAIIDLDQAIQLDPKSAGSYIDRGIVLYRMRKYDRAFADIAKAKQIETGRNAKPAPASTPVPGPPRKLHHLDQALVAPAAKPKPRPQTAPPPVAQNSYASPNFGGIASATFQ